MVNIKRNIRNVSIVLLNFVKNILLYGGKYDKCSYYGATD